MRTIELGSTGEQIPVIGQGLWGVSRLKGLFSGKSYYKEIKSALKKGIELGLTHLDTAEVYGLGKAEEVLGDAIKTIPRDDLFITTKLFPFHLRKKSMKRALKKSLKRLNLDYVDLYLIHWPSRFISIQKEMAVLEDLVKEGLTRYIGVSNFGVDLLEKCRAIYPVQSLQPPYSMLHKAKYPQVENEIIAWCEQNEVGVVAYGPLQNGLLTGKFTHEKLENLASDDWRHRSEFYKEPLFSQALEFVKALKSIAENYGKSTTELAIAWVLMNPALTSAIIGARRPDQVDINVSGSGWEISREDMEQIQHLIENIHS